MRRVREIYRGAGTAGAALDTGVLNVEQFHTLEIDFKVTGAATGVASLYNVAGDGTEYLLATRGTIGVNANPHDFDLGRDIGTSTGGVPRRLRFTLVSPAGANTVDFVIRGVSEDADPLAG